MNKTEMHELCKNHLHRYVLVRTYDNHEYDGIIENVDNDNLYLAVPVGGMDRGENLDNEERFFGPGWYGGFPYYGSPYYGYPFYPRPVRFRSLVLPLAALTALALLPYY
ncbi:hypothetical protein ACJ2A9_07075 [Anaerobacillus sp. MEB173]|uniref:hypothetical protein n=1 Tax=Anaerobacillus sp. MEB173 TaxID=3383345 RepID=UPI003F93A906